MTDQWRTPPAPPDAATHDRGIRTVIRAMHAAGTPLTARQTEIAREMGIESEETNRD